MLLCLLLSLFGLNHSLVIIHRGNNKFLILPLACTGWDRMTADNVLLKTLQSINLTVDSSLAKHFGCLLE